MEIVVRPLDSIRPYERNPRENDDAVDAVASSLREFGFRQPIVVDPDGVIVCGHTRFKAAQKLGLTEIPVHVARDLSPEQLKAYRLADNKTAELAEWNLDLLPLELTELQHAEYDLGLLGFGDDELAKLLGTELQDGLCDPDEVPAPPDEAVTQPGDLWLLGDHRLLCGDSSKAKDLDRLLDGQPIHLVNTDPPYNVKVEPRSNNAFVAGKTNFHPVPVTSPRAGAKVQATTKTLRAKDRPLDNDNVSDEEFAALLDAWFANIARALVPGGSFYIWGGYANLANYPPALKKHDLYFSQAIVWDKQHPVLTRKNYMGAFELAFHGWRLGAAHSFYGPNNARDIWYVKKVNPTSMCHLTQKPVELAETAIVHASLPGQSVLDLFGGSGSTLIGAQRTGRRSFLMELDPLYCDIIVDRYQRFTGESAVLERTGESPIPVGAREEAMR